MKRNLAFFVWYYRVWQTSKNILTLHEVFWHLFYNFSDIRSFLLDQGSRQETFLRRAVLSLEIKVLAYLFSYHQGWLHPLTLFRLHKGFKQFWCKKRSLLKNPIGCSEQNILKKWLTFQWRKFLVFCLVLPNMSKLMGNFIHVQDLFCHSLNKVKDCFCRTWQVFRNLF